MNIILWITTLELLGIVTHLSIFRICKNFSYVGFSISKPLFLLLFGVITWLLHFFAPIEISKSFMGILVTIFVITSFYINRNFFSSYINSFKSNCLIILLLFFSPLIIFGVFLIIKSLDPSISHTEQPMDFAFLNAVYNSNANLPSDPWFKGESINYYYFGYWIFGRFGNMLSIPPEIAYNLSLISIPYLAFSTVSGIVIYLVVTQTPRLKQVLIPSIFASSSLVFLGNLYTPLKILEEKDLISQKVWDFVCIDGLHGSNNALTSTFFPNEFWWWFKSTRIINHFGPSCNMPGSDYTINEFPFFSFILGDLHPHVMSIPFVITFVIIAIFIVNKHKIYSFETLILLVLFGITGFGVTFINIWNITIVMLITVGISLLKIFNYQNYPKNELLVLIISLLSMSLTLLFTLIQSFESSIHGVYATNIQSDFTQEIVIWLPFLIIHFIYLIRIISMYPVGNKWRKSLFISMLFVTSPLIISLFLQSINPSINHKTITGIIFTIFSATSIFYAFAINQNYCNHKSVITLSLIGISFFLLAIPEFLFLGDIFNNRMNTIFKFYYLAWIFLSITSGICFYESTKFLRTKTDFKKTLTTSLILLPFLLGFLYLPASIKSITPNSYTFSIDGFYDLKLNRPHEAKAIFFAKENIPSKEGILEAVGEWNKFGLISSNTGISNVINWPDHEKQWRKDSNEIISRINHVDTIYKTTDSNKAKQLMNQYEIKFILIGENESIKYNAESLDKFYSIASTVFSEKYNGQEIKIMKLNNE